MNTPSHLIINAALRKKFKRVDIPKSAFLWGSILPDIPLGLISIGFSIYYQFVLGQNPADVMESVFHQAYFNNPWWIASHNFLHSPLSLGIYLVVLWRFRQQAGSRGHWWFWFVVGCLIHTSIDIPVHFDDGPLLFWPLDWHIRFNSPVSYWDPAHYGIQFIFFEFTLDIALLIYLFLPRISARFSNK